MHPSSVLRGLAAAALASLALAVGVPSATAADAQVSLSADGAVTSRVVGGQDLAAVGSCPDGATTVVATLLQGGATLDQGAGDVTGGSFSVALDGTDLGAGSATVEAACYVYGASAPVGTADTAFTSEVQSAPNAVPDVAAAAPATPAPAEAQAAAADSPLASTGTQALRLIQVALMMLAAGVVALAGARRFRRQGF